MTHNSASHIYAECSFFPTCVHMNCIYISYMSIYIFDTYQYLYFTYSTYIVCMCTIFPGGSDGYFIRSFRLIPLATNFKC